MTTPNAAPTNVFYITDDYATSGGGGGSHQRLGPNFTAPSQAAAQQVAGNLATSYGRPVRLQNAFGDGILDLLLTPGPANVAMTNTPSGIGY